MTGVEHDDYVVKKLDKIITGLGGNWELRAFQNNFVPVRGAVLASYTQATFSGYAAQAPAYGAAAIDANSNAKATAAPLTFTHNGGATANDIYGFYLVDTVAGLVVEAWRLGAPVHMSANGDNIVFTPSMYQGQIVPPL